MADKPKSSMNASDIDEWDTCKHQAVSISQELAGVIDQMQKNPVIAGVLLERAQQRAAQLYRRMEAWRIPR